MKIKKVLTPVRLPHKDFSKFKVGLFVKNNKVVKQDNIPSPIFFSKFRANLIEKTKYLLDLLLYL